MSHIHPDLPHFSCSTLGLLPLELSLALDLGAVFLLLQDDKCAQHTLIWKGFLLSDL